MKILLTTDVIHPGGAETFVLRLASALKAAGHEVVIFPLFAERVDWALAKSQAPGVQIITHQIKARKFWQLIDGLLWRMGIRFSFVTHFIAQAESAVLRAYKIDVVHSHLFPADRVAIKSAAHLNIPVVTTIHGDYSAYDVMARDGKLSRIPHFQKQMQMTIGSMKHVVCISEEQVVFFQSRLALFPKPLKISKIYNGFTTPYLLDASSAIRNEIGIPANDFVFCMVARGIAEKGWEQAINAFQAASPYLSHLVLIGDSEYVQLLKAQNNNPRIHFLGKKEQPFIYLKASNAGLFCSTILTEALPTVIIEYLAAGLPVISTEVGEARIMLEGSGGTAGILVDPNEQLTQSLTQAFITLRENSILYQELAAQTASAFSKFDMDRCVAQYLSLYK